MPMRTELRGRRSVLSRAWDRYLGTGRDERTADDSADTVRPEIMASWERSSDRIAPDGTGAPMADPDDTRATWAASPLSAAVERLEPQLRAAAEDGHLVVAVTDPSARILWTHGGRVMRRQAESVNFVPGGRWDEASVGTNALDLALRLDGAAAVYSAEHFSSCVHGWVCWAAPVHDPATGRQLGVLDLSTTWDRAHPIGLATATALARLLEREIPTMQPLAPASRPAGRHARDAVLELRLLGRAEAWLDGVRLLLTRRQTEILAVLALNPDGLSLDALHAQVYGDGTVARATLKAEVSHLRAALGARITSRPYRLDLSVRCDVTEVLRLLRAGDVTAAAAAYGGDLLTGSDSPALVDYGHFVAVALREALLADPRPEAVLQYAERAPYDVEVLERAVAAVGAAPSVARPLLMARLRAAQSAERTSGSDLPSANLPLPTLSGTGGPEGGRHGIVRGA